MKRLVVVCSLLLLAAGSVVAGGRPEASHENAGEGSMMMSADLPGYRQVDFTTIEDAAAYASEGPAVLFFYATWCPTCQAAMKDLAENGDALGDDITLIIVDYDRYAALKRRYGVTYQHTFVQIDANAEAVTTWNGGGVDTINRRVDRS